jgi:hypothetical protein
VDGIKEVVGTVIPPVLWAGCKHGPSKWLKKWVARDLNECSSFDSNSFSAVVIFIWALCTLTNCMPVFHPISPPPGLPFRHHHSWGTMELEATVYRGKTFIPSSGFKNMSLGQAWCHISVIPTTWEAEIRRIRV